MPVAVVTGAFSNIGAAVAEELVRRGWTVRTLTNHTPGDRQAAGPIDAVAPLSFEVESLRRFAEGADAFVNTYWIRYPHRGATFETAVHNSLVLLDAAHDARVGRFVQVSVSNARSDSRLGYYRGKARVDDAVRACGLPWAIVRPTLVVGPRDVLTNNIAWFLRRFPAFLLPAGEGFRLQPIVRDDVARVIADAAEGRISGTLDAGGPEIVTFEQYVRRLARALGVQRALATVPPAVVLAALRGFGVVLGDTVLTAEELEGLRDDCLVSSEPPLGALSALEWLDTHADRFGREYANDSRFRFVAPPGRSL